MPDPALATLLYTVGRRLVGGRKPEGFGRMAEVQRIAQNLSVPGLQEPALDLLYDRLAALGDCRGGGSFCANHRRALLQVAQLYQLPVPQACFAGPAGGRWKGNRIAGGCHRPGRRPDVSF